MKIIFANKITNKNIISGLKKFFDPSDELIFPKDIKYTVPTRKAFLGFEEKNKLNVEEIKAFCDSKSIEYDYIISEGTSFLIPKAEDLLNAFNSPSNESLTPAQKRKSILLYLKKKKISKTNGSITTQIYMYTKKSNTYKSFKNDIKGIILDEEMGDNIAEYYESIFGYNRTSSLASVTDDQKSEILDKYMCLRKVAEHIAKLKEKAKLEPKNKSTNKK